MSSTAPPSNSWALMQHYFPGTYVSNIKEEIRKLKKKRRRSRKRRSMRIKNSSSMKSASLETERCSFKTHLASRRTKRMTKRWLRSLQKTFKSNCRWAHLSNSPSWFSLSSRICAFYTSQVILLIKETSVKFSLYAKIANSKSWKFSNKR